jgi:hypothetical protein
MSASLNQLFSNKKVRPAIILIALLMLAVAGCLIFSKPSKERLLKNLSAQLREEKFEQLYEDADDSVRLNVAKEKFVQRMKKAATKLKEIDGDLNFQRDDETEEMMKASRDDSTQISTFQMLKKDGKSVLVAFYWTNKGKFSDIWAIPTQGTSEEYGVLGVSGKYYSIGSQVLEW